MMGDLGNQTKTKITVIVIDGYVITQLSEPKIIHEENIDIELHFKMTEKIIEKIYSMEKSTLGNVTIWINSETFLNMNLFGTPEFNFGKGEMKIGFSNRPHLTDEELRVLREKH